MKKQTIVQFVPSLHDGGGETLACNYAVTLKNLGYNPVVIVLYKNKGTANYKKLIENNIETYSLYKSWNIVTRVINKLLGPVYGGMRLKSILTKINPVAIHGHMVVLKYLTNISDYLSKEKINLLYTCHSIPERYFTSTNKVEFIAAKKLIKKNNLQLIALHNEMKKVMNAMFDIDNVIVIKNGVNIARYSDVKESRSEIRKSLGIDEAVFVLGHVGRFVDVKNHSFLIDVFSKYHQTNSNSTLLLVGSGPLEQNIREKINSLGLAKNVVILSDQNDVERILKAMDVYVFPSKYEGMPISLIEAEASGCYCVVSKNVTKEAIITDKCTMLGIDAPVDDWVNAIDGLIPKMPKQGNLMDFDLESTVKILADIYIA